MESEDAESKTKELIDTLQSDAKKVYLIPPGGSNATGALGYTACVDELTKQIREKQINNPIVFDCVKGGSGKLLTIYKVWPYGAAV